MNKLTTLSNRPRKLIKATPDIGDRETVDLNVLADSTCRYDLDETDVSLLEVNNEERLKTGNYLM